MASKSASKAPSSSSKPTKGSKSAAAATAAALPKERVVSRETAADNSDADMDSASDLEATVAAKRVAGEQKKPTKRAAVEDSSSSEESSSEEEDESEDELEVQPGTSQSLNYSAPRNMQKVVVASGSNFDYAKLLANPALKMYTVRLPDNVKTKSLEKISLQVNPSGDGLVGSLSTKAGEYIIKAADPQGATEELKNLRLLVPDAKSSSYVSAPHEVVGALSLTPIVPIASSSTLPPSSASAPRSGMYVPPPKPVRLQPLDKMKFRNAAFGGGGADVEATPTLAEAAAPAAVSTAAPASESKASKDGKEKKSKKRKEVGEAGDADGKEKKKKKKKTE